MCVAAADCSYEIKMGLDYYPTVLFETLANRYEELADDFREAFGIELWDTSYRACFALVRG